MIKYILFNEYIFGLSLILFPRYLEKSVESIYLYLLSFFLRQTLQYKTIVTKIFYKICSKFLRAVFFSFFK
ncbi:hypothetical protein FFZ99_04985 [Leptospira interrogans]|uniref:Uncharacterized protein n=2 Tax=Leptospira interrogans TaxID=173 RepID=A0A0F6I7F7_LEPIR|nr:hypothetical protein B2G47_04950 [Leptospira interrogans serovar Canicola]EJO79994.1 hypothetical protein LEP1GSC045_0437 [Leptospira interrogans serovar Pomona str. Kennewicki LC82-25]EKO70165.1 hypothetical protein LEP1GSC069_2839 [Leptospira interrogans serovar Canicola str. Fiocruz LV133]EMF33390.1 hypothetical protein LEP1GSC201_4318 [Leptospira interrogans serovar Pomona str. Fox 32256]EMI70685.1 hypothetical protein LEP1GSC200_3169 [Leptospira interrogans serovar Pomona str. CSL10083]